MRRVLLLLFFIVFSGIAISFAAESAVVTDTFTSRNLDPSTLSFHAINQKWVGDWQERGQQFTQYQSFLFSRLFLLALVIMPTVFLLHYILIGAKEFSHDGPMIPVFSLVIRIIHWFTALSFTLLATTGLMVIFGRFLGGGLLVQTARSVHLMSAIVFSSSAFFMLLIWFKDMLPMPHDVLWMFVMGGYLSKKKKPIPAGKFNAGQKAWFWLATLGGSVMAWSGYQLYTFQAPVDQLRLMAIIHNFLGATFVAFFIIHLYMVLFAIKGSFFSMINGKKPLEELQILHSRCHIKS